MASNNKNEANKKPNWFESAGKAIKDTFAELKNVTWPSFATVVKSTGVVLGVVLIFTVVVTGINFGLNYLFELITKLGG